MVTAPYRSYRSGPHLTDSVPYYCTWLMSLAACVCDIKIYVAPILLLKVFHSLSAGWRARARRPAGPYPQYVDDGQLALGVALVMGSARCFLQRRPWVSTPRREGAADVPAGPDDAPFLLKVRWLLEALFHPLRAAPWHVAEGDAWGSDPGWTAA